MNISISLIDWEQGRSSLLRIRHEVFVEEQGVPVELEHDAQDRDARHLLVSIDGQPVATARMLADGHIGRMAVLREWRRRGIGTAMLRRLIGLARADGLVEVVLNAQVVAEPFYQGLGFDARGGLFEDAGIAHRQMVLNIQTAADR